VSTSAVKMLFLTKEGHRLHPDNFVKRRLTPLVKMLGLKGGLHAFRHGNASALDELGVPMKIRQERLGHHNPRTTMKYTHKIVDADVQLAQQLDDLFCPDEHKEILCATVHNSEKEALTPNTQGLTVQ
jgi:integrase